MSRVNIFPDAYRVAMENDPIVESFDGTSFFFSSSSSFFLSLALVVLDSSFTVQRYRLGDGIYFFFLAVIARNKSAT